MDIDTRSNVNHPANCNHKIGYTKFIKDRQYLVFLITAISKT